MISDYTDLRRHEALDVIKQARPMTLFYVAAGCDFRMAGFPNSLRCRANVKVDQEEAERFVHNMLLRQYEARGARMSISVHHDDAHTPDCMFIGSMQS